MTSAMAGLAETSVRPEASRPSSTPSSSIQAVPPTARPSSMSQPPTLPQSSGVKETSPSSPVSTEFQSQAEREAAARREKARLVRFFMPGR
jgi:hypothetical protein